MEGSVGETSSRLVVTIHADDVTAEEAERLSAALRDELLLLEVASVDRAPAGPVPDGAKSGAAQTWGALLVSGVFSAAMVKAVAQVAAEWLRRNAARSVTLEQDGRSLVIEGASAADVDRLVQEWLKERPGETEPSQQAD